MKTRNISLNKFSPKSGGMLKRSVSSRVEGKPISPIGKVLGFAEGKTKARLPVYFGEQELRTSYCSPRIFFIKRDRKGRPVKDPITNRLVWTGLIAVEKKDHLVLGHTEKNYVYYPAKEDFDALIQATKNTCDFGPGYFFPGSFGSVRVDESKKVLRILNIQTHFRPHTKGAKDTSKRLPKDILRKYHNWKQRVFETILLEALQNNKQVEVSPQVLYIGWGKWGYSILIEKGKIDSETFIATARKMGFKVEAKKQGIIATPQVK